MHPQKSLAVLRWTAYLLLAISALTQVRGWRESYPGFWRQADFRIYRTAAQIVADGRGHELYDLGRQYEVQRALYAPDSPRYPLLPFNHPAFEVLPYLAIANLHPQLAYNLWLGVNLLMVALGLWILHTLTPAMRAAHLPPLWLWALAFYPLFGMLIHGQDSAGLFLLLAIALRCLLREQWIRAGVALALMSFKFQIAVPMCALVLVTNFGARGFPKLLAAMAACAAVLLAAWLAITGPSGLTAYQQLTHTLQFDWPWLFNAGMMSNLRGLVGGSLHDAGLSVPIVFWGVILASVAFFAWAVCISWKFRGTRSPGSANTDLATLFALQLTATLLVSYHLYPYDDVLLMLPMLLALERIVREARFGSAAWLLITTTLALGFTWVHNIALTLRRYNLMALLVLLLFFGLLRQLKSGSITEDATPA